MKIPKKLQQMFDRYQVELRKKDVVWMGHTPVSIRRVYTPETFAIWEAAIKAEYWCFSLRESEIYGPVREQYRQVAEKTGITLPIDLDVEERQAWTDSIYCRRFLSRPYLDELLSRFPLGSYGRDTL